MTCCKGHAAVFNKKGHPLNRSAFNLLPTNDLAKNTTIKSSTKDYFTTTPRISKNLSSDLQDPDLPPCQFRTFQGTVSIGSNKLAVYNCSSYNMAVHKSHCLKCPLLEQPKK